MIRMNRARYKEFSFCEYGQLLQCASAKLSAVIHRRVCSILPLNSKFIVFWNSRLLVLPL
ncbi:hypothetical protein CW304_06665 [Bacillus sp. UFRGS-B20]|nr:hypothetical protein CW304_06665 [Bacillus sp. UFRGS-B20]